MYNEYAYDNDFDTLSNHNSSDTDETNIFTRDKYYDVYSLPCTPYRTKDDKIIRRTYIHCYGTAGLGSKIRNAVSGTYYNYNVGSVYEDLLFKVIDSTGRNKRRDPLMLYYDNPEQYERHKHVRVSQESKDRWHKKHMTALATYCD